MTAGKTRAVLDGYHSALPGTLKRREAGSRPETGKNIARTDQAASMSVRAKSPPLNSSGSPVALASA